MCKKLRWPDCSGPGTRKVRFKIGATINLDGVSKRYVFTVPFFFFSVQELEKEGAKAIATQSEEPIRYDLDEEALCKPLSPKLDKNITTHELMRIHATCTGHAPRRWRGKNCAPATSPTTACCQGADGGNQDCSFSSLSLLPTNSPSSPRQCNNDIIFDGLRIFRPFSAGSTTHWKIDVLLYVTSQRTYMMVRCWENCCVSWLDVLMRSGG